MANFKNIYSHNNSLRPSSSLNTQGCCFICLKLTDDDEITENGTSQSDKNYDAEEGFKGDDFVSLREICRHLKIDTGTFKSKYITCSNEIRVLLCEDCRAVVERFSKLSEILMKTQMEMDYCLETIHGRTLESRNTPQLVQNYSKKMTRDPNSLTQLVFVDQLRKDVLTKSSNVRFGGAQPRIHLIKVGRGTCVSDSAEAAMTMTAEKSKGLKTPSKISPKSTSGASTKSKITEKRNRNNNNGTRAGISKYCVFNSSTGGYACKICKKEWNSPGGVASHYVVSHNNRRFTCNICKTASYTTRPNLMLHQEVCSKNYKDLSKSEKRELYKNVCNQCGKKFYTEQNRRVHQETVHLNVRRFSCNICDKKYTSIGHLKEHKELVHFLCKICGEQLCTKENLQDHYQMLHPNRQIKKRGDPNTRFPCDLCDKIYKSNWLLKLHKDAIHFGIVYKCKICNKAFKYQHKQRLHERKCSAVKESKGKANHYRVNSKPITGFLKEDGENGGAGNASITSDRNNLVSSSSEPVLDMVCKIEVL